MSFFDFCKKKKEKNSLDDFKKLTTNIYGDGVSTDTLPNAYGEFGWDKTNPIPVSSVLESYEYLEKLKFNDGMKVIYNRLGSFSSPICAHPIDGYRITHPNGKDIGVIYISPYQNKMSNLKPKGLK